MAVKVAVIGVGAMGKNHARVYAELPSVELAAVSDSNPDLANELADKYGVLAYQNYAELLKKEKPQAVSIAVPTAMHEKVASAAMQAGAHVLIEKPIASKIE